MNKEEKIIQKSINKSTFKEKLKKIFNVKNPWMWITLVLTFIVAFLLFFIIVPIITMDTTVEEKEEQKEEVRSLEAIKSEITIDIDSTYYLMNNINSENLKKERIAFHVDYNNGVISLSGANVTAFACGTTSVYVDYKNAYGRTILDDKFDVIVTGCEEKSVSQIHLFRSLSGSLYFGTESYHSPSSEQFIGTYKCYSDDCKYYDIYYYDFTDENAEFVIYDDGYYLYNFKTQTRQKISLTENDEYSDGISYNQGEGEKPLGMTLTKEVDDQTLSAYFSIKDKKIVIDYSMGYNYVRYISETDVFVASKMLYNEDGNDLQIIDILDGETKKVKMSFDDLWVGDSFSYLKEGDQEYYYITYGGIGDYYLFYTLDFKPINKDLISDRFMFDTSGNLIAIEDDKRYVKYNDQGAVVETSKDYEQVLDLFDDYFFVVKDGYYKLISYKNKTEVAIAPYVEDGVYHRWASGYFSEEDLLDGKPSGYYFVISIPHNESENYDEDCYEYYYIPETGEIGRYENDEYCWGGYAKPVLYLYPEKDNTKISVSFEKPWLLTTTYPEFDKVWEVIADRNGDLIDKDGKYYYGLYWEEDGSTEVTFEEGFYVTEDNAIEFLEEKLSIIGLNDRERNEFIMYWLPILEKNEKNLVYFELTEEREAYNKLNINPMPDSFLRVAIHVKKVDKKTNIKEQKLETFKRVGFTAIEWGGVIH